MLGPLASVAENEEQVVCLEGEASSDATERWIIRAATDKARLSRQEIMDRLEPLEHHPEHASLAGVLEAQASIVSAAMFQIELALGKATSEVSVGVAAAWSGVRPRAGARLKRPI